MLKTGLEFAPGTDENDKRRVQQLCPPAALFNAYRDARAEYGTSDIVLWTAPNESADIYGGSRMLFCERLAQLYGRRASEFSIWKRSAQSAMRSPIEANAFWVVIENTNDVMPITCVVFAQSYDVGDHVEAPAIQ